MVLGNAPRQTVKSDSALRPVLAEGDRASPQCPPIWTPRPASGIPLSEAWVAGWASSQADSSATYGSGRPPCEGGVTPSGPSQTCRQARPPGCAILRPASQRQPASCHSPNKVCLSAREPEVPVLTGAPLGDGLLLLCLPEYPFIPLRPTCDVTTSQHIS